MHATDFMLFFFYYSAFKTTLFLCVSSVHLAHNNWVAGAACTIINVKENVNIIHIIIGDGGRRGIIECGSDRTQLSSSMLFHIKTNLFSDDFCIDMSLYLYLHFQCAQHIRCAIVVAVNVIKVVASSLCHITTATVSRSGRPMMSPPISCGLIQAQARKRKQATRTRSQIRSMKRCEHSVTVIAVPHAAGYAHPNASVIPQI